MKYQRKRPLDVTDGAYLLTRLKNFCREDGDCMVWTGCCNETMPVLSVKSVPRPARRVMYENAIGPIRAGYEVVSTCGTPKCIAPEHLKQIDKAERRRGMAALRNMRGQTAGQVRFMRENHGKLTMEKAREIRASEEKGVVLAARFGVSAQLVSLVRRGQSWAEPSPWAGLGARK